MSQGCSPSRVYSNLNSKSLVLTCSQRLSEPGGPEAWQAVVWHGQARTDRAGDRGTARYPPCMSREEPEVPPEIEDYLVGLSAHAGEIGGSAGARGGAWGAARLKTKVEQRSGDAPGTAEQVTARLTAAFPKAKPLPVGDHLRLAVPVGVTGLQQIIIDAELGPVTARACPSGSAGSARRADQLQAHPDSRRPGLGRHHVSRRLDPFWRHGAVPAISGAPHSCHNVTPSARWPPRPTVQGRTSCAYFLAKSRVAAACFSRWASGLDRTERRLAINGRLPRRSRGACGVGRASILATALTRPLMRTPCGLPGSGRTVTCQDSPDQTLKRNSTTSPSCMT